MASKLTIVVMDQGVSQAKLTKCLASLSNQTQPAPEIMLITPKVTAEFDAVTFKLVQPATVPFKTVDDFTTRRVYLGAERLAFMNAGLYMYRQRPDSLSARQNSTKIFTLAAVEKWIATLALSGLDVAPEIEAYRLRLLSHRSKMELHNAQDVVTYKTVCHTLKMLDKYCPGAKS